METLSDKSLKELPAATGVYIMRDRRGSAIYVGKAKNLRARVRSYFHTTSSDQRPQIPYLMKEVADVDFLVTETEREALILENSLIKKHKPRYNIMLKDDKNYSSLRINPKERFPKLVYTRKIKSDGASYFGPFSSAGAMRQTKKLIHKMFPLRDCTESKFKRHRARPCLNYYIKTCSAPCAGKIDEAEYGNLVRQTHMFLNGRIKDIVKSLREEMKSSASELRYEAAARLRDQIRLIENSIDVKRLVSGAREDKDVIGFFRDGERVEFLVLFSRDGTVVDKAGYSFQNVHWDDKRVVAEFLNQFYGEHRYIPKEIVVPLELDEGEAISTLFSTRSGKKVTITHPKRGHKAKSIKLAMRNAEEGYAMKLREAARGKKAVDALRDALSLKSAPEAIECYDISNIQGVHPVASMVRFEHGKPARQRYRRFRIKTVKGANDYAMMYEVLSRRILRAGEERWELPGLIVVDGGKGQLNVASAVMQELGISDDVALASIAKPRDEEESDKIYVPGNKKPLPIAKGSKELHLLMRIRDEAHRFAVTYHKSLRTKKALESELDLVPGIGERRKKALLAHFGTLEAIAKASLERLSELPGMNRKAALEIKERLGD